MWTLKNIKSSLVVKLLIDYAVILIFIKICGHSKDLFVCVNVSPALEIKELITSTKVKIKSWDTPC